MGRVDRGDIVKYSHFLRELYKKTAEPIDLPFGLWTRVGRSMHKFNRIRQVAPMFPLSPPGTYD